MGPLPTAPGSYKYAAVAVEYFSKWTEPKALREITAGALQKFFWQNIVCCFGIPKELTVDNGKQFDCVTFQAVLLATRNKIVLRFGIPPAVQ